MQRGSTQHEIIELIMKKDTVLNRLSQIRKSLEDFGVTSIGLFGSTVRGENTKDSDIDIIIDFAEGKETYRNFLSVCETLQSIFKRNKLDVVTRKGLSPYFGETILNETQYV